MIAWQARTHVTPSDATMPMHDLETDRWSMRRLNEADAEAYHGLRLEGLRAHPLQFRVAPEDERELPLEAVAARLAGAFVVGGFDAGGLAGVAGLTRFDGARMRHRGLLWGMYVHRRASGRGLGEALVRGVLDEAAKQGIEQVLLTVVAGNDGAIRLYGRCGFVPYGTEPRAVKTAHGYLDEVLMVRHLA